MKLSKQQVIMHRDVTASVYGKRFQEDYTDRGHPRNIVIHSSDWADMGSPEVITVTVMPGDMLNDEPA